MRTAIRSSSKGMDFGPEVDEMEEEEEEGSLSALVYLGRLYIFLNTSDRKKTLRAIYDFENVTLRGNGRSRAIPKDLRGRRKTV